MKRATLSKSMTWDVTSVTVGPVGSALVWMKDFTRDEGFADMELTLPRAWLVVGMTDTCTVRPRI
jgi:hypothetical protein